MSENLSARVRAVLVLAQQESRRLGHEAVAPEHLLAALIAEGRGIAARTLSTLGVRIEAVRGESQAAYGRFEKGGGSPTSKQLAGPGGLHAVGAAPLPYSETAKRVLEQALAESDALSEPVVGTEHLLLAFAADGAAAAAQLLERLGQSPAAVRSKVFDLRAARRGPGEPVEAPKPPAAPGRASRRASPGGHDDGGKRGALPAQGAEAGLPARGSPSSRAESARRVVRASTRAYEPGGRGRWTVAHSPGLPPSELVTRLPTGPRCPGCGGLLEGNLAARRLGVENLDTGSPGPGAARMSPTAGGGRRSGSGPDDGLVHELPGRGVPAQQGSPLHGGSGWLRVVYCSVCGHVLHAASEAGEGS